MNKRIIVLLMTFLAVSLFATENKKLKTDIGLSFLGFEDPPNLILKTGSEKIKLRLGDFDLGGGDNDRYDPSDNALTKSKSTHFGASVGLEINKQAIEDLNLSFGFDIYGRYANTFEQRCDTTEIGVLYTDNIFKNYTARFNLVLGANYLLFNRILFSFEYRPHFRFDHILSYYGREDVGIDLIDELTNKNYSFTPEFYFILSYRF